MSWINDLISGAGEFLKGASYGVIINTWLEKNDNEALNDIEEFVNRATDGMIDEMDGHLLNLANIQFDTDERRRLIKFYAFFKLKECLRYQQWRGFPR